MSHQRFTLAYPKLFAAPEVQSVSYTKEVLTTTEGHVWAFNGWETFYRVDTGAYRRLPPPPKRSTP